MAAQSLTRSIIVTVVGTSFPPVASLVTAPLLAQGLGVEARGEVAAAQAVALLSVSAMAFGVPEAVTYFVAKGTRRRARTTLSIAAFTLISGVVSSLAIIALSGWLGGGTPETARLIQFAGLSVVPALVLGVLRGWAAGHQLWGRIAAERILSSGIRMAGAALLFAVGNLNTTTATGLLVFGPLAGALAYLRSSKSRATPRSKAEQLQLRAVAAYSGRVWIGAVSGILLMRVDQVLLMPLAGATALGLYAVAVSISEVPLVINSAVRDVSFARQSGEFDISTLTQAARLSAVATSGVGLTLAALLPWGLPTLFGSGFTGALPVTWMLLFAVVIATPGSIAGAGLSALGRPGLRSASLVVAATVNVLLLPPLASEMGAMGAAVATLIGNLISSNLCIYWVSREAGTSWTTFYVVQWTDVLTIFRLSRRVFSSGTLMGAAK